MRKLQFLLVCWLLATQAEGQTIAGTNFSHWYDPDAPFVLQLKAVSSQDSMYVFFKLQPIKQITGNPSISWETRESYGQRVGDPLTVESRLLVAPGASEGKILLPPPSKPYLLIAKVQTEETEKSYSYFLQIEPNWPVNGYLQREGVLFDTYAKTGQKLQAFTPGQSREITVYRYRSNFPTASPPFVTKENRVDPIIQSDSTFRLQPGATFTLSTAGLYLFQTDTTSNKGFCYYVSEPDYPRFVKLTDLTPAILYVTTKEEYDEIELAGNDKGKFDKVILGITKDAERAKNFMRSYFRRVELSNKYFTSFKAGWKTDQGMIFTIFGEPDEVSKAGNTEVWNYRTHQVKFTFVRSASLFDPNYQVLIREKRYGETWFSTIDLWRKSRF